ncbi:MAG: LamG domain-containing protein [Verrucomicrobiales bacterium]|nr:LamG domain-containing protein [Verrucomicrobiales bacterium]
MVNTGLPNKRRGYAALLLVVALTTATVGGIILMPNRLERLLQSRWQNEERFLARLNLAFRDSVRQELKIPGPNQWTKAIADTANLAPDAVEYLDPGAAKNTTMRRILLVDPGLPNGLLPYTQNPNGLQGARTNLLGPNARVMIVSNTRSGLTLPLTSGTPSTDAFEALWTWAYDPSTKAPPSGWPSAWNQRGDCLHVSRLLLSQCFAQISADTLRLGVGVGHPIPGSVVPDQIITEPTTYYLLKGTPLAIARTDGTPYARHIVRHDQAWDLSPLVDDSTALLYFDLNESSGSAVTNKGTLGTAWNAVATLGATLGSAGPRPPEFPTLSSSNRAVRLNSLTGKVATDFAWPRRLTDYTLAGWIRPDAFYWGDGMIFGFPDALGIHLTGYGRRLTLRGISRVAGTLTHRYRYPANSWHHVALVGKGRNLLLYVDGAKVASRRSSSRSCRSSCSQTFQIGSSGRWWQPRYSGYVDEVILFDWALDPTQIVALLHGDTSP